MLSFTRLTAVRAYYAFSISARKPWSSIGIFFFFKQKTAYEIGLGIPAEPLFRSRNRRRLKANQTGKKFRVGIKSNISTNRNNLISGVDRCIHLNAMKKTTITNINRQTIKI